MKCTIVIYLVNDSERIDAVSLAQSEHAQLTEHGRELTIRFQDAPPEEVHAAIARAEHFTHHSIDCHA